MKEQLIKAAKEKGFDAIEMLAFPSDMQNNTYYYLWLCELQKWLRDKQNIHISIDFFHDDGIRYYFMLSIDMGLMFKFIECDDKTYDTHEQAIEAGLIEALKLIS